MDDNLEAIVLADEQARARVDAARSAASAGIQAARDERARRQREREQALRSAVDEEERRIDEETARAVAERQARRARYLEARRQVAEGVLAHAAEVYAYIVRDGPVPRRAR
jgi:hypothetical protein